MSTLAPSRRSLQHPARPSRPAGTSTAIALRREPSAAPAHGVNWSPQPVVANGLQIDLIGVAKRFGTRQVLQPLDARIEAGEFLAIVGRSGCGKSTLLRLVAGLEQPTTGLVYIDGKALSQLHADIRIMFQDARLLPWKRVIENAAIGLPPERRDQALDVLTQVGLGDRGQEWPTLLSGGQRQRVALARALVHRPRLLLLDEPLGALDALTRIDMQRLIEDLWRQHGFTAVLVTHDVGEAIALADRVWIIEEGRIALDLALSLPRPRARGSAGFAALEDRLLQRLLSLPAHADGATTIP